MARQRLLACETLKDELELIVKKVGVAIETVWMDNGLHAYPEKLRAALQAEIDRADEDGVEELLFAYGNCGNGLVGLSGRCTTLIIPKFSDCIGLFLNRVENLERVRTNTYFLTKGWLNGKQGLEWEIGYNRERYGEKRAQRIMDMIYKHYDQLMLIDTGAYDLDPEIPRVEAIAKIIKMTPVIKEGDITPLEKLLKGEWDTLFCIVPPGNTTNYKDFE